MIEKIKNTNFAAKKPEKEVDTNEGGYPPYPPSEDIYNQFTEEMDIDPENVLEMKPRNEDDTTKSHKAADLVSDDVDVANSELDDADEAIGNEDEENNYYSIGGDNHNDLEENDSEKNN
jgi:hypothetical protein